MNFRHLPTIVVCLVAHAVHADDTPRIMQMAIAKDDLKLLAECVAAGIPADGFSEPFDPYGTERQWGALALATVWKKPRVVQWLLDHGAKTWHQVAEHRTALDLAVEMGDEELCRLLAKPESKDHNPQHGIPREVWRNFDHFVPVRTTALFLRVNGGEPSEDLLRAFREQDRKTFAASNAAPAPAHAGTLDGTPSVFWFKEAKSGTSGSVLSIETKQPDANEWIMDGRLEGRPAPGTNLAAKMPVETVRVQQRRIKGSWVVMEPSSALLKEAPPPPDLKDPHLFLWEDVDSLSYDRPPALVRLLVDNGIDPLRSMGEAPLETNAFLRIAFHNEPRCLRALLETRPDLKKQKWLMNQAVEEAFTYSHNEIMELLAVLPDERKAGGFHREAIERLFHNRGYASRFKHCFITFNDESPAKEMLDVIRGVNPAARPWSDAEELADSENGSCYRHKKTKEPGMRIEGSLALEQFGYSFRLRMMTGPFLAGGGIEGRIVRVHGHWVMTKTTSRDE